jgi:hypothetical protein
MHCGAGHRLLVCCRSMYNCLRTFEAFYTKPSSALSFLRTLSLSPTQGVVPERHYHMHHLCNLLGGGMMHPVLLSSPSYRCGQPTAQCS